MRYLIVLLVFSSGCSAFNRPYSALESSRALQRGAEVAFLASQVVADQLVAEAIPAAEARADVAYQQAMAEQEECRREAAEAQEAEQAECPAVPDLGALLAEQLAPWSRLGSIMMSIGRMVAVWGMMNATWQEAGEQPPGLQELLCEPLGQTIGMLVALVEDLGVGISGVWRILAEVAPAVCQIGS